MKERIRKIMESQHMTQQTFAQFIGMSPALLSSIFNERTKPTINIVEAIKNKIPKISTDWLMFGIGDMYIESENKGSNNFYNNKISETSFLNFSDDNSTPSLFSPKKETLNSYTQQVVEQPFIKNVALPQKRVTEIRIFYDDQTWESFYPSNKATK
ncbi:DNA-binding helix-turn-helix protein [Hoylesella saccharolytica F0055]|uniref:DNA-binding helix-turn-helix protein n=1 Tax=Hoylesella saccharolytica F0055 TaxID=1127699 RepID=L1N7P1_9BACT|nr:helix-turn-helix transcriptional regulator [Hoylesella saccharolytica]EKX99538.1 DNA-binding helix-turn-helix protein [Hoylesella saccharolytica F0055]